MHGRWTLPAYQQVAAQLATSLQQQTVINSPLAYDDWRGKSPMLKLHDGSLNRLTEATSLDRPLPLEKKIYTRGDTVTTRFYSGNPTAHYNRDDYFMTVEMLQGQSWVKVADDHDWSTKIRWSKEKKSKPLIAELSWDTTDGPMVGQYRMKHTGFVTLLDGSTKPFEATSDTFTIR